MNVSTGTTAGFGETAAATARDGAYEITDAGRRANREAGS
jgi:hypothetical protein